MSFGKSAGTDELVYFMPIKETQSPQTIEEIIEAAPELEEVRSQVLMSEQELIQSIAIHKNIHTRPISKKEYDDFVYMLKNQETLDGKPLFQFELSALAKVIKENFEKFSPSTELSPVIEDNLNETMHMDSAFKMKFEAKADELRSPYITQKADEVPHLYSPSEKVQLKSKGLAFLSLASASVSQPEVTATPKQRIRENFIHPMLKYGLIKRK